MSQMFMNLPIDLAALDIRAIIALEPDVDRDGVQRRDYEGVRVWNLVVTCKLGRAYETLQIQFSSDDEPKWDGKSVPAVQGLTARPWSKINDRKKLQGGIMWQADSVGFKPPATTRQPAAA